jgi:hypothetical protein
LVGNLRSAAVVVLCVVGNTNKRGLRNEQQSWSSDPGGSSCRGARAAGYQFNRNWSAEIGVGHFGEATGSGVVAGAGGGTGSFSLKADGFDVTGIGTIPLSGGLGILARLGVYRARTTLDQQGSFFAPMHEAGTQSGWTYGAGLSYTLGRFGLRAEWQRYDNIGANSVGTDEIDLYTLGALFRF